MRKLAAIMFTDIVGYTALMGKDEQKALDLLHQNRDFLKPLIQAYNGEWLKEIGDGTLSSFASAVEAVNCALEIQQTLLDDPDLQLRIGIHIGDVVFEGGDVFGDGVNVASRIEPLAEPGGICVSEQIYDSIRNKPDIGTAFLGAKMLKNVDHPIQVYALTGEGLPTPSTEISAAAQAEPEGKIKGQLYGRLGTILGLYFAAGFGVVVFVDWLVNRYVLSPHLPDFSLVALLSMVPSIALLAYYHGTPGQHAWTRVERIGIPVNLLATAVILLIFFRGTDLGAAQKTVTVEDEDGNKIERIIPKGEFRKKVALFYFNNESGDSTLDWLQYGITMALETDLDQDLFLDIKSEFAEKMREAGYSDGIGLPLTLRKKIADDQHLDYFVSGSFARENDEFSVEMSLYETRRGKLLKERTFIGENIFALADEMSVQLKYDLRIPDRHIEEVEDLPVSELLTNSMVAYRQFVTGYVALELNDDWEKAANYLEQAVVDDTTFAYAHWYLAIVYMLSNQADKAETAMQATMQHIYKFPEKDQFLVKFMYYSNFKQDQDKAFRLIKYQVELFPEDIEGRSLLAMLYMNRNQTDEAISEYKRILELDPGQYDYLQKIGSLYKESGEFEAALSYYKQYADHFPNKYESFTAIGGLYKTLGDHEQAMSYYEKALLIEPEKISVLLKLADITSRIGNFAQALQQYQEALEVSKTPQQRMQVYASLKDFYELRGQLGKSLEYLQLELTESETIQPPAFFLIGKLQNLGKYIKAGQRDVAFQTVEA
ncbi:MAG: tetratricopeptide repeat protein, partial [Candidatus Marinimicrobia bacterium]|nr:tetratricopeptide repeat protein [Candidatus Neomarinimicrobiota bacterium]